MSLVQSSAALTRCRLAALPRDELSALALDKIARSRTVLDALVDPSQPTMQGVRSSLVQLRAAHEALALQNFPARHALELHLKPERCERRVTVARLSRLLSLSVRAFRYTQSVTANS